MNLSAGFIVMVRSCRDWLKGEKKRRSYILRNKMNVFKNILTGEYHVADNKTRAWLYFFYKAERMGKDKPTMNDIIIIEIDKRIIDLKK